MNPLTQSKDADRRFLASTLTRYGTVHESIKQVRYLRDMAPDGQVWWSYIEARLAYLIPCPALDPRKPHRVIVEGA